MNGPSSKAPAPLRMRGSFPRIDFHTHIMVRESLDRSRFQAQEAFLHELLEASPRIRRLCSDCHGIGMKRNP